MEPSVELNELMQRIRQAANQENGLVGGSSRVLSADSDLPPVPEPLPPPVAVGGTAGDDGPVRTDVLLADALAMLGRGQKKNAVSESVPKLLRPLYRNQGGVNAVVLAALGNLVEANRNLRQQNYELNERLVEFHTWAHSVAQASAEIRDWMFVADARLQSLAEGRLAQIEARLTRLEEPKLSDGTRE